MFILFIASNGFVWFYKGRRCARFVERIGWEAHHGGVPSSLTEAPRCGDVAIVDQFSAAAKVNETAASKISWLL